MAEGAFHTSTVFLPVLVTNKAELRSPGGQASLIRPGVTGGTPSRMGQLRHVLGARILRMTEAAVLVRRMVDGVTLGTALLANRHGGCLMAEVAAEPHFQMGLMDEAAGGKG